MIEFKDRDGYRLLTTCAAVEAILAEKSDEACTIILRSGYKVRLALASDEALEVLKGEGRLKQTYEMNDPETVELIRRQMHNELVPPPLS